MKPGRGLFIGRFFGIAFYLDYSWFLIAAIVSYTLSTRFFPLILPGRTEAVYLVLGITAAALYFFSILLHELGHSIVSQACGIPVPRITLLFIGGLAEISREPDDSKSELKIAAAGPAVSAVLVAIYELLAFVLTNAHAPAASAMFHWLATVNLVLIVFNAIPGYPLDGGRILRALLWARTGNFRRATYVTSRIGVGFSWLMMLLGVLALFQGEWSAFVFLLIGIFLKTAAESGYLQAVYHEVLAGVAVRDVMSPEPSRIPATTPLNLVVEDFFLANHHVAFPVADHDGSFRGLLRLEHLKAIPRAKWPFTSAGDLVAENGAAAFSVAVEEPAEHAMRRLLRPGHGRLAVLENGRVVGMITRHDVLQFIKIHTELEA